MEKLSVEQRKAMIQELAGDDIHVVVNMEVTGTVFAKVAANTLIANNVFKRD